MKKKVKSGERCELIAAISWWKLDDLRFGRRLRRVYWDAHAAVDGLLEDDGAPLRRKGGVLCISK
jgi:hypothetical protein